MLCLQSHHTPNNREKSIEWTWAEPFEINEKMDSCMLRPGPGHTRARGSIRKKLNIIRGMAILDGGVAMADLAVHQEASS